MEYAQKKFELEDDIRLQHLETSLDGVPVELHFFPCSMNNPLYHARLQKWFICNARISLGCPMGQGILLSLLRLLMWCISCVIFIIISLMRGLE